MAESDCAIPRMPPLDIERGQTDLSRDAGERSAEAARDGGCACADVQNRNRSTGVAESRRNVAPERARSTPVPMDEVDVREREAHFRIGERRIVQQLAGGPAGRDEETHGGPPPAWALTPIAAEAVPP